MRDRNGVVGRRLTAALAALFAGVLAALTFGGGTGTADAAIPGAAEVVASGLNNPRGLEFGPEGALYVTNNSVFSGTGQVLRVAP